MDDYNPKYCVGLPLDAFILAMKGYTRANPQAHKASVATVNWRVVRDLARTNAETARKQDAFLAARSEAQEG